MTVTKTVLGALALALSAAPAFAGQNSRGLDHAGMPVSMQSDSAMKTTIFGLPASQPTVWGHAVQDRTHHDVGREITGG